MSWVIDSPDDEAILEEIAKQTDRGCALIAAAFLEQRLLAAIRSRLNRNAKAEEALFRNSGPVGSFSARIELGLLLGIYTEKLYSILHTIREIRNDFAHKPAPMDFKVQRVRDLITNIYFGSVVQKLRHDSGREIVFSLQDPTTPREGFLAAVKIALLCLDMEIKNIPHRQPAAPILRLPPELPKGAPRPWPTWAQNSRRPKQGK